MLTNKVRNPYQNMNCLTLPKNEFYSWIKHLLFGLPSGTTANNVPYFRILQIRILVMLLPFVTRSSKEHSSLLLYYFLTCQSDRH